MINNIRLIAWLTITLKQRQRQHETFKRLYGPESAAVKESLSELAELQELITKLGLPGPTPLEDTIAKTKR